jgi:hypothetical protein
MKKSHMAAIVWIAAAASVPAAVVLLRPPKAEPHVATASVHRRTLVLDTPVSLDPAGQVTAAPDEVHAPPPPPPPPPPVFMHGTKIVGGTAAPPKVVPAEARPASSAKKAASPGPETLAPGPPAIVVAANRAVAPASP